VGAGPADVMGLVGALHRCGAKESTSRPSGQVRWRLVEP
jgi:hypothetical protein